MPTKIHWIYQFENKARIGIMARPRGNEWLEDEIKHLKYSNVNTLISLLESDEVDDVNLGEEDFFCSRYHIGFINFPIRDRSIPMINEDVDMFIVNLGDKLEKGASIVIHCRMGIGRSSIIAGAVLLKFGFSATDIMKIISSARGISVPDTEEQLDWLQAREKQV